MYNIEHNEHDHNGYPYLEYVSPPADTLTNNIKEFRELFQSFCIYHEYEVEDFYVDESLLLKAFLKTDRQKLRYKIFHGMRLSEHKIAGILAYWIIRFKPLACGLTATVGDNGCCGYTTRKYNEEFAIYLMLATLESFSVSKARELFSPTERQINILHHAILHRPLSEDILSTLLEPISEMLKPVIKSE